MALTLKQTGTGKTWTSGSRKQEENKQTTGANTAPAAAPSAAPPGGRRPGRLAG